MSKLNANKTHCKRGHPFSGDNLRIKVSCGRSWRMCRICTRIQAKKDAKGPGSKKALGLRYWKMILDAYGPICVCCGETEFYFLTLDHMNGHGEGCHHRKNKGTYSVGMYRDIIRQGYPKDKYRILCMQCNWATRFGRPCPHVVQHADALALAGAC